MTLARKETNEATDQHDERVAAPPIDRRMRHGPEEISERHSTFYLFYLSVYSVNLFFLSLIIYMAFSPTRMFMKGAIALRDFGTSLFPRDIESVKAQIIAIIIFVGVYSKVCSMYSNFTT